MKKISHIGVHTFDLHLVVVIHTLLVGLCLETFLNTLYADLPANMSELYNRARQYINIEENFDTRRNATQVTSTSNLNSKQAFKRMC